RDCASTSWGLKASEMQATVRLVRLRVTVVLAQGHRRCAHQCALGGGQKGIPDVQDQDRPRLVATVPGLVLNGVIEHPRLTGSPFASLRADPKAAARRYHERYVHDQAGVGDAGVRRDAGARLQDREKSRGRLSRYFRKGRRSKQRRRLRTLCEALILPDTALDQIVRAPAAR